MPSRMVLRMPLRTASVGTLMPPIFLTPFLQQLAIKPSRLDFSTTAQKSLRTRDRNKNRGVSALRRTGLKKPLSMSKEPLPQPVLDPAKRSKIQVDPNHGLWGFFKDKKALSTPEEDYAHGNERDVFLPIVIISNKLRSALVCRRATTKVMGRSTQFVVGLRQGTEPAGYRQI